MDQPRSALTKAPGAPAPALLEADRLPDAARKRDLRLDLFRGLALWLIFLDHIPSNAVSWITIRNYGFSDAAEMFVFISGYTAGIVYGRAMRERGFLIATARILRRVWQIYAAHIFLFMIYTGEIAIASFANPLYAEEMGILDFLKQPDGAVVHALLLQFKPHGMDVLPLYIMLLVGFPPLLWLLRRLPVAALAASVTLYALRWEFDWYIPAYPSGQWGFNPFAWQLLFVFGAWCALGGGERMAPLVRSPVTQALAAAYLIFSLAIVATWYFPHYARYVPRWLGHFIYPIDKINLDVLRFAHFLALAVLTVRFVPRGWPPLHSALLRPLVLCGQHSLEIFCAGVFLAFAGHLFLVEVSDRLSAQVLVSALGIAAMIATARVIAWYKGDGPKQQPDADLAGGAA
jgi:hypothetical protein